MSWRRILLLSLAFVVVLGSLTWNLLQRSDAATRIVRRELQALLQPPVQVATTELDLAAGRLTVRGLRVDDPMRAGEALLTAQEIRADVGLSPSAAPFGVRRVVVDGFVLAAGPAFPDAAALFPPRAGGESGAPPAVPPLELRGGRVRLQPVAGEAPVELAEVELQVLPLAGEPHCLQLRGAAVATALGVPLQFAGELDLRSGAGHLWLTLRAVAIDDALVERVFRLLRRPPPPVDVAGALRTLTLSCRLPARGSGEPPTFELAADLGGVQLAGDGVPRLVHAATVRLHASSAAGGTATVQLQQDGPGGQLAVRARGTALATEPRVDVHVQGAGIPIDAETLAALRLFDTGRDVVAALAPTAGRADLELFLRDPHRRGGLAELELRLRDVAMSFEGFGDGPDRAAFPLPMEHAEGRVRLRDDVVLLEDVQARIAERAGGGTVRLQGRVDTMLPAGEDTHIDIHAEQVRFGDDLRLALTTLLDDGGDLYDRFAPTGQTAITVQLRPRSELPGGWAVEVRPTGASMRWAGFPYRLDDLGGSVRVVEQGATFDLAGRHGDGTIAMHGTIPLVAADESPGFAAAVTLQDLTIDDELRGAVAVIAPELDQPWRDAAPTGRLSGQVKVWRDRPADPLHHDARLELAGAGLLLPAAPWRARALAGRLFVQGTGDRTRIDFDALRGELEHGAGEPAALAMLGHLIAAGDDASELTYVVRELELDDQLGRTLEQLGALGPGAWASLAPSGRVDLVCRHRRGADGDQLHLVVHLVDVRSGAPILPHPAEHMTGELTIAGGELRFDDLRAELGGALARCTQGRVHTLPAPDGRTVIEFTVEANGVPVDDGIANLFSGPLRRAVLERQLLGRADIDALRLRFAVPPEGNAQPYETTLGGQLRLYDLDMTLGTGPEALQVEGIRGVVTLADSTVSTAGGTLRGALRGVSLRVFGQLFEAIDATFEANERRLQLAQMTSRCHGGVVRGARPDAAALAYLLPGPDTPDGRLSTDLVYERVDVYSFLDACGWFNPPYSGSASGEIRVERLDGSDVVRAAGDGSLRIERGDLGAVPLFTAIYAQLPAADRPRFQGLDASFHVADGEAVFDRLDVTSNILAAQGSGTLSFDGYLDVRMRLANLLGSSADPLVMPLIDYLAGNIVRFHLHGYLRDLRAEQRWLTERSPARRPVLPMPPERPRPSAPDY